MSPALEAHLRLLAQLPSRRHEWEPFLLDHGHKRTPAEIKSLTEKLLDLESRGYTRKAMMEMCGCTRATIVKYIGPRKK